jgi:hypothetical protein
MKSATVSFLWQDSECVKPYRTAVCLHGHTLHSEECLSFLPRYLHAVPGASQIVRAYQQGPNAVDFARAWWTPPLTPASALRLEQDQIAKLGLRPIVSLTDHDNIQASMTLLVAADRRRTPVSVEWTVPYRRSIFHLGVHNLAPDAARSWMAAMSMYTLSGDEELLPPILSELAALPDALIVLNHPFWIEEGVVEGDHAPALERLLRNGNDWLHAFELNGTRRWHENRRVLDLAAQWNRPVISGGDRHACEPSACLNLTGASCFAEFAAEVREGRSHVVFMPQYHEPMPLRIVEAAWDILRPYPEYPDREHWTDRVFYRGEDGVARPVSKIWQGRVPLVIRPVTGTLRLFSRTGLRPALRYLFSRQDEAAL